MRKKFNNTGVCISKRHYMVDTSPKIEQIIQLVEEGEYFTINRPRQFGKTTTMFLLDKRLRQDENYVTLRNSFEGIDSETHLDRPRFIVSVQSPLPGRRG